MRSITTAVRSRLNRNRSPESIIAKNRNTYAKRQREQEKKQRADDKRIKRDQKKEKRGVPAS